jgi:2-dehydro-3-deoxygluconokinase
VSGLVTDRAWPAGSGPAGYVLTVGESMALMSADRPGPLAHASTMSVGIGGAESNVAIGLARLGVGVVWAGRVGDDALGRLVTREIRAEGVDVRARVDGGAPTGLMVKERRTASSQSVSYYRAGSAGSRLAADDVPAPLVEGAALVHLTGITPALSPGARDAVRALVATARAAGVPVSFDLNYRSALWSPVEAGAFYREVLPLVDLVFAGDDEARIAVGDLEEPADLAAALRDAGAGAAVVKLGAAGALALVGAETVRVPALPIAPVDTVGAGDAFVAGYLADHLAGRPVRGCLGLAVACGAFACLVPGDWEGLPRREELGLLTTAEPVTR